MNNEMKVRHLKPLFIKKFSYNICVHNNIVRSHNEKKISFNLGTNGFPAQLMVFRLNCSIMTTKC